MWLFIEARALDLCSHAAKSVWFYDMKEFKPQPFPSA